MAGMFIDKGPTEIASISVLKDRGLGLIRSVFPISAFVAAITVASVSLLSRFPFFPSNAYLAVAAIVFAGSFSFASSNRLILYHNKSEIYGSQAGEFEAEMSRVVIAILDSDLQSEMGLSHFSTGDPVIEEALNVVRNRMKNS
jgi:hypothetical protein